MPDLDAHLQKCRLVETLTISIGIAVLAAWLILHLAFANWNLVTAVVMTIILGAVLLLIARFGYESVASLIAQLFSTAFIIAFCLAFDNGSGGYPRTSHLFFISIMIYGYYRYAREPSIIQILIIAVCFVGFCLLASVDFSIIEPFEVDHAVFAFGGPVNVVAAMTLLCIAVGASHNEMTRRNSFLADVRRGLRAGEFVLHLQPQTDREGRVYGAEALIRWNHPREGLMPPAHFIPLIERWDRSEELSMFISEVTFDMLAAWQLDPPLRDISISINLSPKDLLSTRLTDELGRAYRRSGLRRGQVKIEITESMAITDKRRTAAAIHKLQEAGYQFSLDDFGVGYSGLSRLRDLHLSEIKLDKSFTDTISDASRTEAIVAGIVLIAKDLDATLLAEGVESEAQWNDLKRMGCDSFQGFLFGRPMPRSEFEKWVREARSRVLVHEALVSH